MRNKKAFTLIELLVVIAIIALLMAVILPALNKAKEHARMLVCKSNQRSILQAVALYSTGNNGKLPGTIQGLTSGHMTLPLRLKYHYGAGNALNGGALIETLGGYMDSPEYFDCPMAGHDVAWQRDYLTGLNSSTVQFLNCTYFMFWNWTEFENTTPSFKPTDRGGDNLLICDVVLYNDNYNNAEMGGGPTWVSSHPWRGAEKRPFVDNIAGGTLNREFTFWKKVALPGQDLPDMKLNAGYKDGHVEAIDMQEFRHMSGVYWLPQKLK